MLEKFFSTVPAKEIGAQAATTAPEARPATTNGTPVDLKPGQEAPLPKADQPQNRLGDPATVSDVTYVGGRRRGEAQTFLIDRQIRADVARRRR